MEDDDTFIQQQADDLFGGDLAPGGGRKPLPYMPSASQIKKLGDVTFSTSRTTRTSLQPWSPDSSRLLNPGFGRQSSTPVGGSPRMDDDPMFAAYRKSHRNARRTSSQSAWSSTSGVSKSSKTSNVWRRDSLFSFGAAPEIILSGVEQNDQTDGQAAGGPVLQVKTKKRVGIVTFTRRFFMDTASHGMPRIMEKNISIIRRVAWACLVIAATTMLIIQTRTLISRFYDREFKVDVKYNFNKEISFPGVTLCSLHALNRTKLECSRFDTSSDLVHITLCNAVNDSVSVTAPHIQAVIVQARIRAILKTFDQASSDYTFRFNFTQEPITAAEYSEFGFDLEQMLVSCTFRGQPCNVSDFKKFQNSVYGNCYTFNHDESRELRTSQPGPDFGLTLELFIDTEEELGVLSEATGIRVALHETTAKPFPEEDGFSIAPGHSTSVGIRQVLVDRLASPYGNCSNITGYDWSKLFTGFKYTRLTCLRECQGQEMLRACGCVVKDFLVGQRLCNPAFIDPKEAACADVVLKRYYDNDLTCAHCFNPCSEKIYRTTLSQTQWPATEYQRDFKKVLRARNFEVDNRAADLFRDNYVRLQVFYEELNYENIVQKPAYEPENLLADIGGQLGLWVGLSVLAILEFVEYFTYIILVLMGKVELPMEEEYLRKEGGQEEGESDASSES